uniref:Uncharacterized protein n=1 Tax=Anopheles minimus TaxID=112268 RepID=A0A182WP38_9DIPT
MVGFQLHDKNEDSKGASMGVSFNNFLPRCEAIVTSNASTRSIF